MSKKQNKNKCIAASPVQCDSRGIQPHEHHTAIIGTDWNTTRGTWASDWSTTSEYWDDAPSAPPARVPLREVGETGKRSISHDKISLGLSGILLRVKARSMLAVWNQNRNKFHLYRTLDVFLTIFYFLDWLIPGRASVLSCLSPTRKRRRFHAQRTAATSALHVPRHECAGILHPVAARIGKDDRCVGHGCIACGQ